MFELQTLGVVGLRMAGGEVSTVTIVQPKRLAVRVSPEDERAVAQLIRLLDRSGDRVGALRTYESLRVRLREEFGVSPSPETERLVGGIRG